MQQAPVFGILRLQYARFRMPMSILRMRCSDPLLFSPRTSWGIAKRSCWISLINREDKTAFVPPELEPMALAMRCKSAFLHARSHDSPVSVVLAAVLWVMAVRLPDLLVPTDRLTTAAMHHNALPTLDVKWLRGMRKHSFELDRQVSCIIISSVPHPNAIKVVRGYHLEMLGISLRA